MAECKWLHDEICCNDECPVCADYCPVVNYPGVCKYEESAEPKEDDFAAWDSQFEDSGE